MLKNFDEWNQNKKMVQQKVGKFYHARDIWWCSLGVNVGYEHDGEGLQFERPILILRGLGKGTCLAVPLTTSDSKHPMRIPLGNIDGKPASAVISQIRVIDTRRLINKICYLDEVVYETTRKAVRNMI